MRYWDIMEGRMTSRDGLPYRVYKNPSREVFTRLLDEYPAYRGLLSPDGKTVYLWNGGVAVHTEVMNELALGDHDCVMVVKDRGHLIWNGPVRGLDGRYVPAIERLTPTPKTDPAELDRLYQQLKDEGLV